jgi:hypothetical protein
MHQNEYLKSYEAGEDEYREHEHWVEESQPGFHVFHRAALASPKAYG